MTFCSPRLAPCADRSLVTSRHPHYHPYQHDSDPESYHHQPTSHVPRPLPASAIKLQDPRLKCEKNLRWNIDWAVAFLVDFLDPKNSPDAAAALTSIRQDAASVAKEGHALEIPYRYFNKLNETLFAGHLKNAVYLDIRKLHPDVSGATHAQGWGLDPKVKRLSIHLNKDIIQHAKARDLLAILIHQMIHAYFLIACGPQVEKETEYGRLDHGLHFGKIMITIKKLSGMKTQPLNTLDFGHTLGQSRLVHDEYCYQQCKSYRRQPRKAKWYRSQCYFDVATLADGEIDKYYNRVCKPLLELPDTLRSSTVHVYNPLRHILEDVPRAETTSSAQSSEFLFHDKAVLVPAARIDTLLSVRRAFESSGSRYMVIHAGVSQDTFERFLELLHTGSYGPDPKHIHALGRPGPPIIKAAAASDPYLLTNIHVYKMGVCMGFNELKGMALDRMYKYSITHEDPITILTELYAGGEPDADLKAWTRKFLGRVPEGQGEPSNLAKLECELLGYKPRFYDLLQQSSALKYEVGKARRELVEKGLYAAAGVYGAVGPVLPLQQGLGLRVGLGLGAPVGMRPGAYLGLPWVSPAEEMERRAAAAAAAAAADPYLPRGLGFAEEYDDIDGAWV